MNRFIDVPPTLGTLDIFYPRNAVLKAIREQLPNFKGKLLDLGAGQMPYKTLLTQAPSQVEKYISLDMEASTIYNYHPDLYWNGREIPLPDDSIDTVIATEVFEHCPEIEIVLKEIYRVLKPGGILFFTVPFLWPIHDAPYDEYRYTPFALERHLKNSNFENVTLKGLGGWDASMGQMIALWVRRRFLDSKSFKDMTVRAILSVICYPFVLFLTKFDKPNYDVHWNVMILGITGIAYKLPVSISSIS